MRDPKMPDGDKRPPHWIGVMLLGTSAFPCHLHDKVVAHKCRQVLDGQQRLLTLRLWMLALVDEYIVQTKQTTTSPQQFSREQILQTEVHGLNQAEWDALRSETALNLRKLPDASGSPMIGNYLYFRYILMKGWDAILSSDDLDLPELSGEKRLLDEWRAEGASPLTPNEIVALLVATGQLKITVLEHQDGDGPIEQIFETLNSKNTPLGQYDLFRNFILMRAAQTQETRRDIYNSEMKRAEEQVRELKNLDLRQTRDYLDAFFQDFVSTSTGTNASANSAAAAFQDWWKADNSPNAEKFIRGNLVPSMFAWRAAITAGQQPEAKSDHILSSVDGSLIPIPQSILRSMWRIENLARRSFVPVTITLLTIWASQEGKRSPEWLASAMKTIETYAARSILAARPSSPFRGTAIQAANVAKVAGLGAPAALHKWFASRVPSDDDVRRVLLQSVEQDSGQDIPLDERRAKRDFAQRVQNSAFCAIFDGIACQLEGESAVKPLMLAPSERMRNKPLQIEHLYPKSNSQWRDDLDRWGQDLARMDNRLHAIGNTTVLPFRVNQAVSNHPLAVKQKELQKDGIPKYQISRDFYAAERWTIHEIDRRSMTLCEAALKFWAM